MIVNVASACGFTPHPGSYRDSSCTRDFGDKLAIVGFPANNFGSQEPGSNDEIKAFYSLRYGGTFPPRRQNRHHGPSGLPCLWLTRKSQNGVLDSRVDWNFQKYLPDENGFLAPCLPSPASTLDDEMLD
jgi:glutathione peroxidase